MIFKPDVNPKDLDNMSPTIIMLIGVYFQFCFEHQPLHSCDVILTIPAK